MIPQILTSTLFPYTTLFRSDEVRQGRRAGGPAADVDAAEDVSRAGDTGGPERVRRAVENHGAPRVGVRQRSEEHTSELQSHSDLVCRLLLEKKNTTGM